MKSEEFRSDPMFLRNQFKGNGTFEFPTIKKVNVGLKDAALIGYDKIKEDDKESRNSIVHFFLDDYKFEVLWNDPEPRLKKLQQYKAVLSPQFSAYYTMPYAMQLYQVFRSRWCGAYMQAKGLTIIPTVYWGKPQSYWFAFEGIEEGCIIAVSTVGVKREKDFFLQGYKEMLRRIKPKAILCYGQPFPEMEGNVIVIDYAKTNNLTGHKKYWTICSVDTDGQRDVMPFAAPFSSKMGLYVHKVGGTILSGFGSGGGLNPMGRHNGKTPRDHRRQNRQTSDIAKDLNLTKAQQRELHDLISGQGMSYQEILEFARQWFQNEEGM